MLVPRLVWWKGGMGGNIPLTSQFSCSVSFCRYAEKKMYSASTPCRSLAIWSAELRRSMCLCTTWDGYSSFLLRERA